MGKLNGGMFSSKNTEWETPQILFDLLDAEFCFTLDATATPENAKVETFYTREDDALGQPWTGVVWCNPPYGRLIGAFVAKGHMESTKRRSVVVMLVPARTDTFWWHEHVMKAAEIRFIRGRLTFVGAPNPAPFPSAIVVFKPYHGRRPLLSSMQAPRPPRRKK
jgi:phage N-6-adenine-methyltransferase